MHIFHTWVAQGHWYEKPPDRHGHTERWWVADCRTCTVCGKHQESYDDGWS